MLLKWRALNIASPSLMFYYSLATALFILFFCSTVTAHTDDNAASETEQSLSEALAEDTPPYWQGEFDLGFNQATGNSDNSSLYGKLKLNHDDDKWQHKTELSIRNASVNDKQTAEEYIGIWQTNYKYSENSYSIGSLRAQENHFGQYKMQVSATVGYGHNFYKEDKNLFSIELGVGMSHQESLATGDTQDKGQFFAQMLFNRQITDTTQFEQKMRSETDDANTFLESDSSLKVAITTTLALKVGYIIRRNTNVSVNVENTDTFTHVGVHYTF